MLLFCSILFLSRREVPMHAMRKLWMTSKFGVYLLKKWGILYTARFLMRTSVVLWGSAPMRGWNRWRNCEELWGSVETVKVFCMSHGNGLLCSRPSPPFYTRHIFPIMQRKWSRDANSNGGPTCMKCFRGGEWQCVNLPFLYHYDGKNGNYRYKWTQYYGT